MDIIQALILSFVEGVTEFLPISSTGHLILASDLMHISQTEFVKSFEIIIQLGAIMAVVVLYAKRLLVSAEALKRVVVAFIPTGIVGLTLYKLVKEVLIGNYLLTVAMLLIGGIALIVLEKLYKEKEHHLDRIEDLSYKNAFIIGLIQSISVVPGVSRAATTILGGMFLGLKRVPATEFSFLLAIPVLIAASGLDILKSQDALAHSDLTILAVGFIGAFLVALVTVKWLVKYISSHNFIAFGVYRIVLSILFWLILLR